MDECRKLAGDLSAKMDADILILNYSLDPGFDQYFIRFLSERKKKKKRVVLILATEGGDANVAYRISRALQQSYESFCCVVAGWCKSAGTLLLIGADTLCISETGEMGPLDVQIAKLDEVWERSSGLTVEAAFEKLQEETFNLFNNYLMAIKTESHGRITFRTAADIAAQITIGLTSPIFAKLDPINIGEDYRSNRIAEQYAFRLNMRSRILKPKSLEVLLHGYVSHGFVIDIEEASHLFERVSPVTGPLAELISALDVNATNPRNSMRNEKPILEYLNAENAKKTRAKRASAKTRSGARNVAPSRGNGSDDVRGPVPAGPDTSNPVRPSET